MATNVTAALALKTDKTLYDALATAVGLKAVATDVSNALNAKANLASPIFTTKITNPPNIKRRRTIIYKIRN